MPATRTPIRAAIPSTRPGRCAWRTSKISARCWWIGSKARTRDNSFTTYELQGWYGGDYDRVVLKAEGEIDGGKLHDARTELLWSHAVSAYWNTQLGVRYDSDLKPDRRWLAFGVQGLAPYWFEIDATAYVGENGRTALRFEAEYELLLTQKLILQPRVEANFYGKTDTARERGSGLSDAALGLRLRYEIRREVRAVHRHRTQQQIRRQRRFRPCRGAAHVGTAVGGRSALLVLRR